ncbi:MAG: hypothetical protein IT423_15945 [Pirellulaceae bacterium]|nr:hypothetical protein [Pirellulaceae bacterium]
MLFGLTMLGWATCVLAASVLVANVAQARTWTDASGRFAVQGDLVAHSADHAVIKRENGKLLSITIADLSNDDREYLKSKENINAMRAAADRQQVWHFRGGYQAVGRLEYYGRKEVVVARKRGRVYINDRPLDNLLETQQAIIRRIVAHEGATTIDSNLDIEKWLASKKYQPQTFLCEGVILVLENGDEVGVPFFLFSDTDRELLEPGWQRWLKAKEDAKAREQESFMLQAQAQAYELQKQQTRAAQATQQIAMLQLGLLATASGALWEVELLPAAGNFGYPLVVVVPGGNSAIATQTAMQRNPGYVAGITRRASL